MNRLQKSIDRAIERQQKATVTFTISEVNSWKKELSDSAFYREMREKLAYVAGFFLGASSVALVWVIVSKLP
jgi:hypothetical protein